jgi:hypothetical protein
MADAVWAALVTGGLSLAGVIVSNLLAAKKTEATITLNQAVTDTKLEELTREVRAHNNFAQRMPVVENQIMIMGDQIKELQKYHQQPIN